MLRALAWLLFWRALAVASAVLGFVGVFVPGLPTVPFLLVAAWAAGRGWPAFERWLLNHPRYGADIRRWRERRAVPRRAKWAATATMVASAAIMAALPTVPLWAKIGVPAAMGAVAVWLWRRPER